MKSNIKYPVRIAHLQLLPLLSGVQRVTLMELSHIDRNKFEPWIICMGPGPFTEEAKKAGIPCLYVPELVRCISPWKDFRALCALVRLFHEYRFDIVHTHSSKTGVLGRFAARLAGVPVAVHTVHGFSFYSTRNKLKRLFYGTLEFISARMADAIVVLNQSDKVFCRKSLLIPERKLFLIKNSINLNNYYDRNAETQKESGLDTVTIAMVGRLWPQKNPLCLVKAAAVMLSRAHAEMRFWLIGEGGLMGDAESLVAQNGMKNRFFIFGWRKDVPELLRKADIFVLPSLWEGMSIALLEAMASGLPAVVSDIPGNRELIEDGETGFLFPPGDHEKLAECLEKLIQDEPLRKRMGKNARQKAEKDFQMDEHIKKVQYLYDELLKSRASK